MTRLRVLDLGRMRMDSRVMIGSGPSPFPPFVEVPISAYCIEHADGRALFDTGCHPQAMGPHGRWSAASQRDYPVTSGEECTLPHRLEEMGLGPNDFRVVVLSHLHSDHSGCLEFFRKAQIVVHADELAAVKRAYRRREDYDYAWRDTDAWLHSDLQWRPVRNDDGDLNLAAGVQILNLGRGHAYGMLALTVDLRETGRVVLASDAVYCAENLEKDNRPGWMIDRDGYQRALEKLKAENGQIWFGHDPRQFATLRKSTQGWYE